MGNADLTTANNLSFNYQYSAGIKGTCLESWGSKPYFNYNYNDLILGSEFAVSLWLDNSCNLFFTWNDVPEQPQRRVAEWAIILDLQQDGNKFAAKFFSAVYGGTLTLTTYYSGSTYTTLSYSSSMEHLKNPTVNPDPGEFHHVIVQRRYENSDGLTDFFLDGQLIETVTTNSPLSLNRAESSSKFKMWGLLKNGNNSRIDELRLYHRALTPEEIQILANENS